MKKRIKQSLLVGGAVATVGLASLGSVGLVSAATTSNDADPQTSIIDKLVSKFNLNKDEVKKVFDEERSERDAAREAKLQERIKALVTEGKITQAQADKLIAKARELKEARQANRAAMKDKTADERKAAMDAERDSFKKWLSDNGIAEEYGWMIMMGGHGGPGGPDGPPPSASSTNQ